MTWRNRYLASISRRRFLEGLTSFSLGTAVNCSGLCAGKQYGPRTESPARFFQSLTDETVQCRICFRRCIIAEGKTGQCRVRVNRAGRLMTMSYANPAALNVDPIEKKPFYHVLPGSRSFSIAEIGCNIACKFCQNWQIALVDPGTLQVKSNEPVQIAKLARETGCDSIAYTYSEPTTWSEYVIDCATAGLVENIPSVLISNGTMSTEVLEAMLPVIKAIKIDLKSIRSEFYQTVCSGQLAPVLKTIEAIGKSDVWLEIVNLVIPELNDSDAEIRQMSRWIKDHVGDSVPLHFTRFHPMYKLKNLAPTPVSTLERVRTIAMAEGLKYVYIGNVPTHTAGNTRCPGCNALLLQRSGFRVTMVQLKDGRCSQCGLLIPGRWSTRVKR